jgi:hypothetical protein
MLTSADPHFIGPYDLFLWRYTEFNPREKTSQISGFFSLAKG